MGMTVADIQAMLRRADAESLPAMQRALAADQRKGVRAALAAAERRVAAELAERDRVEGLYRFEESLAQGGPDAVIVGLDEVGRGSVAGPLAVAAVVLRRDTRVAGLDDSKKLKPDFRAKVAEGVRASALAWAVEYVEPAYIDDNGMAASLLRAFKGALAQVERAGVVPDCVLVDGNPLRMDPREVNVVKGDGKCASIAAASIVAKVSRDALMRAAAPDYPEYGFDVNKGYATADHVAAIREHGLSPLHRASFCRSFMQETLF